MVPTSELLLGGTLNYWFTRKLPSGIQVQRLSRQTLLLWLQLTFWSVLVSFIYTILSLSLLQFVGFILLSTQSQHLSARRRLWILSKCRVNVNVECCSTKTDITCFTVTNWPLKVSYCSIKVLGGSAHCAREPFLCAGVTFTVGKMKFRFHQSLLWFDSFTN